MKRIRKICVMFVLMLTVGSVTPAVIPTLQAMAQEADGLTKTDKGYMFYKNGKALKNTWKKVKTGSKTYRYYFGKNGIAFSAKALYGGEYNIRLYTINRKRYAFDSNAHLVAKGVYVNDQYKLYAIGKGGVYDEAKTKKLRKALKKYSVTGKVSRSMYKKVVKLLGKPLKVKRSSSCSPLNETDSFTDYLLKYRFFEVQLIRNDRTKAYALDNFFPGKEIKS